MYSATHQIYRQSQSHHSGSFSPFPKPSRCRSSFGQHAMNVTVCWQGADPEPGDTASTKPLLQPLLMIVGTWTHLEHLNHSVSPILKQASSHPLLTFPLFQLLSPQSWDALSSAECSAQQSFKPTRDLQSS